MDPISNPGSSTFSVCDPGGGGSYLTPLSFSSLVCKMRTKTVLEGIMLGT